MTQEIRKLKKNIDKVTLKINQLLNSNIDEQTSIDLYFEISVLLKKILVNYCIAELNESTYNHLITEIECAIRDLKKKDERFNTKFNKREIIKNIIKDFTDDTCVIIEPEVSIFVNQTHNKELDRHLEKSIIAFFRKRLGIIEDINDREENLRIVDTN